MSRLNGDRARFHKDRRRKLLRRQRLQVLLSGLRPEPATSPLAVRHHARGIQR